MAYLPEPELEKLGIEFGRKVLISEKCSIYGAENIKIGNNVRIDDFCIISAVNGFIKLGSHIHIAPYCGLYGGGGIEIGDFCGLSSNVALYSTNENYSGNYLVGPTMFEQYRKVDSRPIFLKDYVAIGSHSVVLPGVTIEEGSILGAMSLLTKATDQWTVYSGVPAKRLTSRKKGLLEKAEQMRFEWVRNK